MSNHLVKPALSFISKPNGTPCTSVQCPYQITFISSIYTTAVHCPTKFFDLKYEDYFVNGWFCRNFYMHSFEIKKNLDLGKIFVTLKIFLKSRFFCNQSNILLAQVRWVANSIAMCVGFGNVWRFPGIVYDNGGAAFVWAYLLILFFIARPLLFLEMSYGQFSGQSNVGFWANICPIFKGTFFGLTSTFVFWFFLFLFFLFLFFCSCSFCSFSCSC